jgi:TPP-dependent pyruvate/acetoin dehydrogenase alpha subunit
MTIAEPIQIIAADGSVNGFAVDLSNEELLHCYRTMLSVRAFDEICMKLQRSGRIGFSIPNKGVEATQVGAAIRQQDPPVESVHRICADSSA